MRKLLLTSTALVAATSMINYASADVSVKNTRHLSEVMADLQKVKGVLGVDRLTKV